MTSGPATGGQDDAGAFVTVYGNGFGSTRGASTVTVGGGTVARYLSWSNTRIVFQLGSSARTGGIVAKVGGAASNSVAFTVRKGSIYFVASSGSDANLGTYGAPWRTIAHAVSAMRAGDIVYVSGITAAASASSTNSLVLNRAGTASAPISLVAYPGSAVTIGSGTGASIGISITAGNWVISGMTLRGTRTALSAESVTGLRIAGNDISCPHGYGSSACVQVGGGSSISLLGNRIHDNGSTTESDVASYNAVSMPGSNEIEAAWNTIGNTRGCRALAFPSRGVAQHGIVLHDNYIYSTRCEAIALENVDPGEGAISIYNNILVGSGVGPAPEGTSPGNGFNAISVAGGSSTPVQVYNNTIYDAGRFGGATAGAFFASGAVSLTNNIVDLLRGEHYIAADSALSWFAGTNNLWFGDGTPLGIFTNSVYADPVFASVANSNFHLSSKSPAIDAGETVSIAADYDGLMRPQGSTLDIGAYEFPVTAETSSVLSVSPSNLSFGTVANGQSSSAAVTLTNNGSSSITISGINSNNSLFSSSGINYPSTLAAGASQVIDVSYTSASAGPSSGTLSIGSNASNSTVNITVDAVSDAASPALGLSSGSNVSNATANITKAAVSKVAAPAVSLSPKSLKFADQTISTKSPTQTVKLTNSGNATLNITRFTAYGNFAETNNCPVKLSAGASCTISVTFTPTAAGTRTGSVVVADNAATGKQIISLSGTGVTGSTAVLKAGSTALSFGDVDVDSSSTLSLVVTNTGTTSASIKKITSGESVFTLSSPSLPVTVNAGASVTLKVRFAPSSATAYASTLSIQSTASNPTLTVTLSGTGVVGKHSVTLTWGDSSTNISGYNVYRSTTSGSGYGRLNSSLDTAQTYVDSAVTAGSTYYYVVTAVSTAGVESSYSADVKAVVPSP
jgi:hypothetical protein